VNVGPPDPDRIAELAGGESSRDAEARQQALRARQRRAEVREAVEAAEDRAMAMAAGLRDRSVTEADVLEAFRERDELRRLLEAWEFAVRAADDSPALRGRR
jgi:hypothetical protein